MLSGLEHFGPSRVALVTLDGQEHSYAALLAQADRISGGVHARCLVFSLCSNTVESVAGYVGLLRCGAVQVLLSDKIDPAAFARLVSVYDPAFVYLPAERRELGVAGDEILSLGGYRLVRRHPEQLPVVHDELSLLLSTSGSTGSPKLVRLSGRNLSSNAEAVALSLDIDESERAITTLGFSYAYGLSILNSHLLRGASISLCTASIAEAPFWKMLAESRATSLGGVPYTFQMLKRLRFASMKLPTLRYLTQAGGRLEPALTKEFVELCAQKNQRFFTMYGQTEATARMSLVPWQDAARKVGSIGKAIAGGILRIDPSGELIYEGANVSLGYAEQLSDLSLGDCNGGVLRTGDLAEQDEEGFFTITGRTQRFVKVFGNRVSLDEVESLVKELGFEAACTGRDDLIAIFVTDPGDTAALLGALSLRTGLHPRAFSVARVQELPRNDAGKVQYARLPSY